jgi:two-component system cell cycle sensor histidine kinase PleC
MVGLSEEELHTGIHFAVYLAMNRSRGVRNVSKDRDDATPVLEVLMAGCDYRNTLRIPGGDVLTCRHFPLSDGGILATYRRITKRYVAEERAALNLEMAKAERERAEEANEHKSAFLANMSHELCTPLNAIMGFAEIIRDGVPGPESIEKYREYARDIHQSGVHLLSLVNDLLDIAKIEAGKMEIEESVINLDSLMRSCLSLLGGKAAREGINLTCNNCDEDVHLRAGGRMLKQVVLNLGSNAIKFTGKGGKLELKALRDNDGGVVMEVRDSGIGMSREETSRALEPFTQIDNGFNRRHEGTGLGLPLARQMTELHGGTLVIDSTPGAGACVTVRLPADRVLIHPKQSRYSK